MELPAATRRRFDDTASEDLLAASGRSLLIERILEEGEDEDVQALVRALGEPALADWLVRAGGRKLSRRSRAYWSIVLGVPAGAAIPSAALLWPLA
jgi:hypothetical protein